MQVNRRCLIALPASEVYAADKLFATLDPTLARVDIEHLGPVLFADTVGFISDLPTTLVEAFKATLEETANASLLLHVVDVSANNRDELMADVEAVLGEIKADGLPQLIVFNKLDLLEQPARIVSDEEGTPTAVYLVSSHRRGHCDVAGWRRYGSDWRLRYLTRRSPWMPIVRGCAQRFMTWARSVKKNGSPMAVAGYTCVYLWLIGADLRESLIGGRIGIK